MPTSKRIVWDAVGERFYETGVNQGVLYVRDATGKYPLGVPWNGLVSVNESPSGAEANPQFADNIKYLNLISAEEFGATVEAYTYPDEFAECDGTAEIVPGVYIGQQTRKSFGFCYRTIVGNDVENTDFGYKIHVVYNCQASPSEKTYSSINESPEAATLSWEITTTPVTVPGYKPTATFTFDSTKLPKEKMEELEDILYGTELVDPRLPDAAEILTILAAA